MSSISPEYWLYIPTSPRFGSLTDIHGGRSSDYLEERKEEENSQEFEMTDVGYVAIKSSEEGVNILAAELGIGLLYEKTGKLSDFGLDLLAFRSSCTDEELKLMGGSNVDLMLDQMKENNDRLIVSLSIKEKFVALFNAAVIPEEGKCLYSSNQVDFSVSNLLSFEYYGFAVFVTFSLEDDVFSCGLSILPEGHNIDTDTDTLETEVLAECNLSTFLDSKSPDKYKRLTKRVFLL